MANLRQTQQLKQTLSPQQVLQANLLQLNTVTLEQKILDELESNPLLEQLESSEDVTLEKEEPNEVELDFDEDPDEYEPANIYNNGREEREIPIPDQTDFVESLVRQLDMYNLAEWERSLAEEILWNLDENGFLNVDLLLIGDRFNRDEKEVLSVLKKVQELDPPGIAAQNLRDCLLIQLREKKEGLAYRVVENHFEDFANHRYEMLQRKLEVEKEDLAEAIEEISHLNPRPGEESLSSKVSTVIPDLLAVKREGIWTVIVNDTRIPELSISNQYVDLLGQPNLSPQDQKFFKEKFDSATWFIHAIEQRRQTLRKVMEAIINHQPEFFSGNIRSLRPMILQDIAEDIDMDISTVSRSTRGKYVDTPYGIFELKSFFTEGFTLKSGEEISTEKIKDSLKEMVDAEDKEHPLTDTELAEKLKLKGYPVARRTVAKYREQLHLPVARLRRQLIH